MDQHTEALLRYTRRDKPSGLPSWAEAWWDRPFAVGYLHSLWFNVPFVFASLHLDQGNGVLIQMSPEAEAAVKRMVRAYEQS